MLGLISFFLGVALTPINTHLLSLNNAKIDNQKVEALISSKNAIDVLNVSITNLTKESVELNLELQMSSQDMIKVDYHALFACGIQMKYFDSDTSSFNYVISFKNGVVPCYSFFEPEHILITQNSKTVGFIYDGGAQCLLKPGRYQGMLLEAIKGGNTQSAARTYWLKGVLVTIEVR